MEKLNIEECILRALCITPEAATYVLRNMLVMRSYGFSFPPSLKTRQVLAACRRLLKQGRVVEVRTSYAVMKSWAITDAGRAAIPAPAQKEG